MNSTHTTKTPTDIDRIIDRAELREIVPASDMTIWRWERDGKFPKRIRLSPNKVGWRASEIKAWMNTISEDRRI